jgi:ubiquinone/menaquinone biosynthesis C-methylase UbiE
MLRYALTSVQHHPLEHPWFSLSQALPFPDNHFSHNLMNMGIQVIPDPRLAMKG